ASDGWELNLFLNEGTHTYKFIADGEWLIDPANKTLLPDGEGHFNSSISLGDTTIFTLNGFIDAKLVILTGNFNNWNTAELSMERTATGWQLPHVLPQGVCEYKFIVDGKWITDPDNKNYIGDADHRNSVKIINPNYMFTLSNFYDAKEVTLSGSFNNWSDPGYTMMRSDIGWIFPMFLTPGKYTYKFVIDGKWILDPANTLIEENEYGNGNSVLWIDPEKEYMKK
ncbi:MAG: hypothetical protein H7Y00_13855, partial [Fimbriimonadaceae bacterium]|nr:hypothetical protein [Chitinophagales bacterium]